MKKFLGFVLTTLAMVAIMVIAVEANKLVNHKKQVKFEEERVARVEETTQVTEDLKSTITEISQLSVEEIQAFIAENAVVEEATDIAKEVGAAVEELGTNAMDAIASITEETSEVIEVFDPWAISYDSEEELGEMASDGEELAEDASLEDPEAIDNASEDGEERHVSEDPEGDESASESSETSDAKETPSATPTAETGAAEETAPEATSQASEKATATATKSPSKTASASATPSETPSATPEGDVDASKDDDWEAGDKTKNVSRVADLGLEAVNKLKELTGNMDSEDASAETPSARPSLSPEIMAHLVGREDENGNTITLEERQKLRTSEEETKLWIEADEQVIETTEIDFSGKKIACIGDSVTEAANLLEDPNYEEYPYPVKLKEVLGCEEVVNLGIGGSSLGRYWADAFCDRYEAIPEDTDIIIVFGGYNDGYCLHEDMVGSLENRDPNTLYGGVNDLFQGLSEKYPNAEVFVMTPLPNLLHDVLRKEREELLPQTVVVDAMVELADEYGFNVIDAYNQNFMDTHDANIVSEYVADSVHPGPEGYEVLAKHVAAEMIRIEEVKAAEEEAKALEESENTEAVDGAESAEESEGVSEGTDGENDSEKDSKDKKKSGISALFDGLKKSNDDSNDSELTEDKELNEGPEESDKNASDSEENKPEGEEADSEPSPTPKKVGVTVIDRNNPDKSNVIDLDE